MEFRASQSQYPPNIRLLVPSPAAENSRRSRALKIGRLKVFGGGPRYELSLIAIGLTETSITFPPGTLLVTGEIFEILRPISIHGEYTRPSRGPRTVVALVKIVGIEQETRALVRVLSGSLRRGFWAEKLDNPPLADRVSRQF